MKKLKILYITSGFNHSYPHRFIDQFISTSLKSISHKTKVFQLNKDIDWQSQLFAAIEVFFPDFVFTIHGVNMSESVVQKIKNYGVKMGIWFVDDPYDIDASKQRLYSYDFVFTNEKECVSVYERYGFDKVYYLPLGVQTRYYYPENPPEKYRSDICFVGSPFPKRVEIIKFLYSRLPEMHIKIIGPHWNKHLPENADLIGYPLGPDEIRKYYNGAKINLNIHRGDTEHIVVGQNLNTEGIKAKSPNNRTFDIAACKAFQLANFRPGLKNYFDLENELITFKDKDDLVEKIIYYIDHVEERNRIATNGYKRTISQHRFENRLEKMMDIVKEHLQQEIRYLTSPQMIKQGRLVKSNKAAVYFIINGKKHLIQNVRTFNSLGFDWKDIEVFSQKEIDQIPGGVTIKIE
ncbi:hypothetical protein BBF96_00525 [Anoxybacter fermentans]|uniref:Spore protein YkvP/CgeB glycosyl transferase-like domain-containing protein n=1 Tax=Anoxybacter fermentans TaxID=1323375 RepID=A0A3S9SUP4_9FIRM|nr:glycosyltransferase [Anoxybacter fermentans]AZR72021.1 hypothetical protein BBF96_00525 [Anoxybacter fermentans]